jgi:hypothetical protein
MLRHSSGGGSAPGSSKGSSSTAAGGGSGEQQQAAAASRAKGPVVHQLVAGGNSSMFLTRAPDELPEVYSINLLAKCVVCVCVCVRACVLMHVGAARAHAHAHAHAQRRARSPMHTRACTPAATHPQPRRLQHAVARASKRIQQGTDKMALASSLRMVSAGVEMVFGSAAAMSAAFGYTDRVGLDVELLEHTQQSILRLFSAEECVAVQCVCVCLRVCVCVRACVRVCVRWALGAPGHARCMPQPNIPGAHLTRGVQCAPVCTPLLRAQGGARGGGQQQRRRRRRRRRGRRPRAELCDRRPAQVQHDAEHVQERRAPAG